MAPIRLSNYPHYRPATSTSEIQVRSRANIQNKATASIDVVLLFWARVA